MLYKPAGIIMKKSMEPIHDTEDVVVLKYSINSTAKMPKLATLLKQETR